MSDVIVMVKPWAAEQKGLRSASFRAEKVKQTEKAVCLRLRDGRELWFPWAAIEKMEWAAS